MELREQELDQEMLEKLAAVFTKLQEYQLNPIPGPERLLSMSDGITPAEWEANMEAPCYTSYFLEALEAGNYKTRQGVLSDFNSFFSRAIEATNGLDCSNRLSNGSIFKNIFQSLQEKFSKKILKATFVEDETFIYNANKQIKEIEELFKFSVFTFNENDILETARFMSDHEIPKKLDVL